MPVDRENGSPPYITNPASGNKHSQSRSLRIMARNQGYDPDAIYANDGSGRIVGSMQPWDHDPTTLNHGVIPEIPGQSDTPGGYPDGIQPGMRDRPDAAVVDIFGKPPFATPDLSKETVSRGVGKELPVNRMTGKVTPTPTPNPTPNTPFPNPAAVPFAQPNHNKAGVGRTTNADPFAGMGGE